MACIALAHLAGAARAAEADTAWGALPLVLAILTLVLYLGGLARHAPATAGRRRAVLGFLLGLLTAVAALVGPLHARAESSFAWHMLQHELLIAVAAPLMIFGAPLPTLLRGFPAGWRRSVVWPWRSTAWQGLWRRLTRLDVATIVHGVALWVWHVPALFNAASTSAPLHALQHTSFFLTALVFWSAIRRAASRGAATLALFLTMLHSSALGALLALAEQPLYLHAGDTGHALRAQQLGGVLMWMPGGMVYLVAALFAMARATTSARADAARYAAWEVDRP